MEFVSEDTCKLIVGVYLNRDGNIRQEDETPAAQKTFTFGGITNFFRFHF